MRSRSLPSSQSTRPSLAHSLGLWPLLFGKEWRELLASRAYWLLLLVMGPLVGNGFISAVNLYAEMSGIGGGPAALSQGLSPLDGLLVPTFGAYELAVTLLFPFVAIRLVASEKESGAWKLALQFPARRGVMMTAKLLALAVAWGVAWLPGLIAVVLWKSYGGHSYWPELLNLLLGHGLRMLLAAGVAIAAAAFTESAASAAIVTLSFTLGTWALDFIAAGRGGILAEFAAYTPTAALRFFEQGLWRLSTVISLITVSIGCLTVAAIWLHTGRTVGARLAWSLCVLLITAGVVFVGSLSRMSRDVSENRRNSFSRADEAALCEIRGPLTISVNLAAEDPRLMDYERGILTKLRRIVPHLKVEYAARSRTGLFEGQEDHYGEIWYELGGRRVMNRSTTGPIVLEQLYELAGIKPPAKTDEPTYPGYPLAAQPKGARLIFYALWPLGVLVMWGLKHRYWR